MGLGVRRGCARHFLESVKGGLVAPGVVMGAPLRDHRRDGVARWRHRCSAPYPNSRVTVAPTQLLLLRSAAASALSFTTRREIATPPWKPKPCMFVRSIRA